MRIFAGLISLCRKPLMAQILLRVVQRQPNTWQRTCFIFLRCSFEASSYFCRYRSRSYSATGSRSMPTSDFH
ncbi:hypothetical protein F4680DRAFT_439680, partial [Xylaria scruposa]